MKRTLVAVALFLSTAAPALAAERTPPTAEEIEARLDQRLDRVGATPQQKETIHGLVEQAVQQRAAFRAEAQELRAGMRDLLWTEEIDRKGLEKLRQKGVDLFDRMTAFGLDHMIDVAEVLTPEQRVQVHDLHAE